MTAALRGCGGREKVEKKNGSESFCILHVFSFSLPQALHLVFLRSAISAFFSSELSKELLAQYTFGSTW